MNFDDDYLVIRGTVIPRLDDGREEALQFASHAAEARPSWNNIALNIFSDASHTHGDGGGIAVTFRPWLPWDLESGQDNPLTEAAWPLDPMYDNNLGELLSIAKGLNVAIQEIRNNRDILAGIPVTVTIFNDGNTGLNFLDGKRSWEGLARLVRPVLFHIEEQTHLLGQLLPTARLFFRWMPGHQHDVYPHQRADVLAKTAREVQRAFCPRYDNIWRSYTESPTVRWLRHALLRASQRSAAIWPQLRPRLRQCRHGAAASGPRPGTTNLQAFLDTVLPLHGGTTMPAGWADSERVVLSRRGGWTDLVLTVPRPRSADAHDCVFINDGLNPFAVVLEP